MAYSVADHIPEKVGLRRAFRINIFYISTSRRPYSRKSRIKTINIVLNVVISKVADHIPEKVGLRHILVNQIN